MLATDGSKRLPNAVRRWTSLTIHLPAAVIAEFSRIAGRLGRSRAGLVRESVEVGALTYARTLEERHERESDRGKVA